jgi:RNA polymerase sigma factor (sigma-70 family)
MPAKPPPPRLADEDRKELDKMLAEARPRLEAIARSRLTHSLGLPLTEDIFQGVAEAAARKWKNWIRYRMSDPPMAPSYWFFRLLKDEISAALRDQKRHVRVVPWPEETTFQFARGLGESAGTPGRAAVKAELIELVHRALDRLPETDRDIIQLHDFDGLTFVEIGHVLGKPPNTVNVRYVRAIRRLREFLAGGIADSGG